MANFPKLPQIGSDPSLDTPGMSANDYFAQIPPPQYGYQFDALGQPILPGYGSDGAVPPVSTNPGFTDELSGPPDAGYIPTPPPPAEWFSKPSLEMPTVGNQDAPPEPPVEENNLPPTEQERLAQAQSGQKGKSQETAQAPAQVEGPHAPTDDEYLQGLDDAAAQRIKAENDAAQAEKDQNDFLSSEGVKVARDAEKQFLEADQAREKAKATADAKARQLEQEAKALSESKLDKGRWWKDLSFEAKAAGLIGAALMGASTAAINTGKNPILDIMDNLMERDMAAQVNDRENKRAGLGMRTSLLEQERAAGREDYEARYKSALVGYDMAIDKMNAYAKRYNNPRIDAMVAKETAAINERKMQMGMDFRHENEKRDFDKWATKQQVAQGWASQRRADKEFEYRQYNDEANRQIQREQMDIERGRYQAQDAAARDKALREQADKNRGMLINQGTKKDGSPLLAPSKEVAEKVNEKMGVATTYVQKLDRLYEIYEKHGWQAMNLREDEREAEGLLQDLKADYSAAKEQGVIHPSEYKLYDKIFGADPSGFLDMKPIWKARRNEMIRSVNNDLKTRVDKDAGWWDPEPLKTTTKEEESKARDQATLSNGPPTNETRQYLKDHPQERIYVPEPDDYAPVQPGSRPTPKVDALGKEYYLMQTPNGIVQVPPSNIDPNRIKGRATDGKYHSIQYLELMDGSIIPFNNQFPPGSTFLGKDGVTYKKWENGHFSPLSKNGEL